MNRRYFEELLRRLDRLEVSLLIRDPGTPLAVDAYEGLRKQVVAAAQSRMTHLAQLAEMSEAVRRKADLDTLHNLVNEWARQAGLEIVQDGVDPSFFETVAGQGETMEVLSPAYVDTVTGRVVRRGEAKAIDSSNGSQSEPAAPDEGAEAK